MSERWGALPLGELHAEGVCYRCGREAAIVESVFDSRVMDPETGACNLDFGLRRTVDRATLAVAHVCVDTIACERRRYKRKNP